MGQRIDELPAVQERYLAVMVAAEEPLLQKISDNAPRLELAHDPHEMGNFAEGGIEVSTMVG